LLFKNLRIGTKGEFNMRASGTTDVSDKTQDGARRRNNGAIAASYTALALGILIASPTAVAQVAAPAASTTECKFAAPDELIAMAAIEPPLIIDADCADPYFNASNFVVTSTTQETYEGVGGPIPYTEIKGHFPARDIKTNPLPAGVLGSPTLRQQDYVFRIPDKRFFRNRSMQVQHPIIANSIVDNRIAFTNGAMSVNHVNAGFTNTSGHWRHSAAATKIAEGMVRKMYGSTGKIYSYYWGCSGGGQMAQAAAEGQAGVWDGVIVICPATRGNPGHAFQWQSHYALAMPADKRARISNLRLVGNGVDASDGLSDAEKALLYAGLNEEEKFVLNELLASGFPLNELGTDLSLTPITGSGEIFHLDPTYEDDFWSKPGYAGANPPAYLAAAKMDGFATVTKVNRNAQGAIASIQLDPATIPPVPAVGASPIGTTGQRFYVYAADGVTRTTDPASRSSAFGALSGTLDRASGLLTLSESNSQVLLDAVAVGGKIRVNNRFHLATYFYPRHTIVAGYYNYDQYRNADGTPKYPQRPYSIPDITALTQGAGVLSLGNIKSKVMLFQNLSDAAAFPSWVAGYANTVEQKLGTAKAGQMLRTYLQERGGHSNGGIVGGVFNQALLDLMAWAEKGIAPKPSTQWRFELPLTQVILSPDAAVRKGLQPVVSVTVNGSDHATVGVNKPVKLAARLAMPPTTGRIVQFNWTYGNATDETVLPRPLQTVDVARTLSFTEPGSYIVRITANGQRNGLVDPADQTLSQNYKEVRVTVEGPPPGERRRPRGQGARPGGPGPGIQGGPGDPSGPGNSNVPEVPVRAGQRP
jgi:hypothetical protein